MLCLAAAARTPDISHPHWGLSSMCERACTLLPHTHSLPHPQDRFGSLFFMLMYLALASLSSLPIWCDDRLLFARERAAGAYGTTAYFTSVVGGAAGAAPCAGGAAAAWGCAAAACCVRASARPARTARPPTSRPWWVGAGTPCPARPLGSTPGRWQAPACASAAWSNVTRGRMRMCPTLVTGAV